MLAAIVAIAFAFIAWYTLRVTNWLVMSDELQHSKLALNVFRDASPLPHMHGEPFKAYSQLYPLLTSPFYALLSMPAAFTAVHGFNALLMASTAVPAYLLARDVTRSEMAGLAVAALTVAVPWTVLSTMVLTESAAYPAFVWALLGMQRAVAEPSPRRDAIALVAIGMAFFARTQFIVLAGILPAAVVGHEIGMALRGHGGSKAVRQRLARAGRRHAVLAVAVAVGSVIVLMAGTGVLGNYGVTAQTKLLPAGWLRSFVGHLDFVIVAIGVLPAVLSAAWCSLTFLRPDGERAHAFAVLVALTVPVLLLEVTSFDLNFAKGGTQDRYAFYIAPLLFTGMAALLMSGRSRPLALLVSGAVFAWLVQLTSYLHGAGPYFNSPASAWHSVLDGKSLALADALGLSALPASTVLCIGTALLGLALAAWLPRVRPRVALVVVAGAVLAYCVVETAYTYQRTALVAGKVTPAPQDWIDSRLSPGEQVAVIPDLSGTAPTQVLWWDTEFWNESVDRAYTVSGGTTYTPFPFQTLAVDWQTGRMSTPPDARRYVVMASSDVQFRMRGVLVTTSPSGLELTRVERPYRAVWATRGIRVNDGFVDRHGVIRVYGRPGSARTVSLAFATQAEFGKDATAVVESGGQRARVRIEFGKTRTLNVTACVRAGGSADVEIETNARALFGRAAGVPGTAVGLRVAGVQLGKQQSCGSPGGR